MSVPITGRPETRRVEPLWNRVDRNRWLLAGYLALFAAFGAVWFGMVYLALALCLASVSDLTGIALLSAPLQWVVGGSWYDTALRAWMVGIVVTGLYEWRAIARSERSLLARLGVTLVPLGEMLDTKMALKDMAIAGGFKVAPALYLIDTNAVNAFVAAAPGRRPVVGVTRGFTAKLTVSEQRAVFATLVARLISGDTVVATAVTALTWPLQAWRSHRARSQNDAIDGEMIGTPDAGRDPLAPMLLFGVAFVILGEIVAALHRRSQLRGGEKADAEGMLLLKEPPVMISALTKCIWYDNFVPSAGETYGKLFYCWTGESTNDASDPEWRRVARLREVVGAEGWVSDSTGGSSGQLPTPPRLGAAR